jgi:sugar lactone lactonase YvrE
MVLFALMTAVAPAPAQDMPLSQILIDGEGWKVVTDGLKEPRALTSDAAGNIYVADTGNDRILRIDTVGKVTTFAGQLPGVLGITWSTDGRLYASQPKLQRVLAIGADGKSDILAEHVLATDLAMTRRGALYCLGKSPSDVIMCVFILEDGGKKVRTVPLRDIVTPGAIALSPDQATLLVGHYYGIWAYRVEADGTLAHGQPYYDPRIKNLLFCRGLTFDSAGRLYANTATGPQVFDPTGRLSGVLLKPAEDTFGGIAFGGPTLDLLYVTWGNKLYARKTQAKGVLPLKSTR